MSFTVDTDKRTGEIGLSAVHSDHAGRGLGTKMIERAPGHMKDLGAAVAAAGTGALTSRLTGAVVAASEAGDPKGAGPRGGCPAVLSLGGCP
jgi:GNAT superfamily N-acetyltransferase